MTEENKTRVQLSVKFGSNGSGYAIVETTNTEDLVAEAGKLMDQAGFINAVVEEIQARSTLTAGGLTNQRVPQDPGTPAGPSVENCAHGVPRRFARGFGKNGKEWKAKFCDVKGDPKLPQCDPIWLN